VNLIVAYGSSGRIAAALRLVTELSSHPPFSFGFLIEMGNVYADMKRHDEAILAYDEAKKLDPSNISSYVNLGILYEKMGRYEEGETQSFSTKACCSNQPSACVVSPTASQSVFVAATEIML
jgi:tetratricopeptide (TPR) repeat protein